MSSGERQAALLLTGDRVIYILRQCAAVHGADVVRTARQIAPELRQVADPPDDVADLGVLPDLGGAETW